MSLKRPSRFDTEDEIMQMQDELLAGKVKPSAEVFKSDKRKTTPGKTDTKEAPKKAKHDKLEAEAKYHGVPMSIDDSVAVNVLSNIAERDITNFKIVEPSVTSSAFPVPMKCAIETATTQTEKPKCKRKSIFAQQMEKMKKVEGVASFKRESIQTTSTFYPSGGSLILDGSGLTEKADVAKIHEENLKRIHDMKPEEIQQHRNELISHLDPKVLQFLKSLRKPEVVQDDKSKCDSKTTSISNEFENLEDTSTCTTILTDIQKNDLPIPLSEAKTYVNMDEVELDKMAWMTMLPKPKPVDKKTGFPARFNFEGKLIFPSSDIKTETGLHHHGNEQEIPGYTLEELYHLSRTAFPAQQVIALRTLAKILANYWQGLFDDCLEESLLTQLLESGIVLLLRSMLDKSDESTIAAAVYALHSLIVNEVDQMCLDKVFSWPYGHISPFLKPCDAPEGNRVDTETKVQDLTDQELVKMDVVKGLLRMDLLPRLRYILDVLKPEAAVVGHVLGILIRISQNSLESAVQVMECPHLMGVIFAEFLPPHWGFAESVQGKLATVYKIPLYPAVCLVRSLASAGRHIASRLITDYKVLDSLVCYLTIDPSDKKLPIPDSLKLNLESLRTWKIFLSYGLGTEVYINLYPVWMKQLQYCNTLSLASTTQEYDYQYAAALLSALESVIIVAGLNDVHKRPSFSGENFLTWESISDLEVHVRMIFSKWIWELSTTTNPTMSGLSMVGSCACVLASYYQFIHQLPGLNHIETAEKINELMRTVLLPFLKSDGFKKYCQALSMHSCVLFEGQSEGNRDSTTLCSLGSVTWAGDVTVILQDGSSFPLLISLARFLLVCSNYHFTFENEVAELFLCEKSLLQYLNNFVKNRGSLLRSHWFTRFETFFLSYIVLFAAKKAKDIQKSIDTTLYHNASLVLPSWIHQGDIYMTHTLLSRAIFHADFYYSDEDALSSALHMLETQEPFPLLTVNGIEIRTSEGQLITSTCQQISAVRSIYTTFSECTKSFDKSRQRIEQHCHQVESLAMYSTAKRYFSEDWIFLPIAALYDDVKQGKNDPSATPEITKIVAKCIQWIHFLLSFRIQSLGSLSPASIFSNLTTVFLAGNDLFLENDIHRALYSCLKQLLKHNPANSLDFTTIHWLQTRRFIDCYKELLEQFEAVSYGDQLFACFVLLPLQQVYDATYKKLLFDEHSGNLRLLSVPLQKLLVPVNNYLYPLETNDEILASYGSLLLSGQLQSSPLLSLMAVHHLHHFLFSTPMTTPKKIMLTRLWTLRHKPFSHQVLYYKTPALNNPLESDSLTENVISILKSLDLQVD